MKNQKKSSGSMKKKTQNSSDNATGKGNEYYHELKDNNNGKAKKVKQ